MDIPKGFKHLRYKVDSTKEETRLLTIDRMRNLIKRFIILDNGTSIELINEDFDYSSPEISFRFSTIGEKDAYIEFADSDNITEIDGLFARTNVCYVPDDLFSGLINLNRITYTFICCQHLEHIPSGLFKNNTKLDECSSVFAYCNNLRFIPKGLFDNNPNLKNVTHLFYECKNLEYVPHDLFLRNKKLNAGVFMFYNCDKLKGTVPIGFCGNGICKLRSSNSFFYSSFTNDNYLNDFEEIPRNCVGVIGV